MPRLIFFCGHAGTGKTTLAKRALPALHRATGESFCLLDKDTLYGDYSSAVMGVLWLSTVPPTNAVVAQIFGVQHMSMLGGFVFFSHQIGSFLGVWLGGKLYDASGSYDIVWWLAVALGVMATLINLPVREHAIARPVAAAA